MSETLQLQKEIEEELKHLRFHGEPQSLYEPMNYMLNLGGKRIRPLLVILGYSLYENDTREAFGPALAIEMFHNFTLMHDDLMDGATLRRGQTTVHKKWNSSTAILSGDMMLIEAYELLAQVPQGVLHPVLRLFNDVARKVCEGQQWDMEFEQREDVSIPDYLHMIELKTATLLGGALQLGGLLARASLEDQQHLQHFGIHLGLAFQIKDDLLDAFGAEEAVGKKIGGDIAAGKKTFLMLKALELSNDQQRELLLRIPKEEQEVQEVQELYRQLKVDKAAEEEEHQHYQQALEALEAVDVPEERKQPLFKLARRLLVRNH